MTILEHHMSREKTGAAQAADNPSADAIVVKDLIKTYGRFRAVNGVDLAVRRGEVFGLLGPNGAGKTTMIECIVGLRIPTGGSVHVLGMDPLARRRDFTSRVAVQPQEASLFDSLRVAEALELFAAMYADPFAVDTVLEQIDLCDDAGRLIRKLSGGQRRRLLLGVAMIGRPEVMVLDEPSAGLDPQARRNLWDVIRGLRRSGTTVLVTTHHMDEATELCDRVAIMVDGRIAAQGTPHELVSQLTGGQTVTFNAAVGAAELDRKLRTVPGVTEVEVSASPGDATFVKVLTTDPDAVLTAAARNTGWSAHNFAVESGDLENVFLTLADEADHAGRTTGSRSRKENHR